jgi:hypothetical protein
MSVTVRRYAVPVSDPVRAAPNHQRYRQGKGRSFTGERNGEGDVAEVGPAGTGVGLAAPPGPRGLEKSIGNATGGVEGPNVGTCRDGWRIPADGPRLDAITPETGGRTGGIARSFLVTMRGRVMRLGDQPSWSMPRRKTHLRPFIGPSCGSGGRRSPSGRRRCDPPARRGRSRGSHRRRRSGCPPESVEKRRILSPGCRRRQSHRHPSPSHRRPARGRGNRNRRTRSPDGASRRASHQRASRSDRLLRAAADRHDRGGRPSRVPRGAYRGGGKAPDPMSGSVIRTLDPRDL